MTIWPDMKRATAPGPDRAEPVEAPRDLPAAASAPVPPVDPARSGAPPTEAGRLDIATPTAARSGAPRPSLVRRRLGLVAAIVLSAAAHAALIGYLLEHLRPEGIEAATDAVSVELLFETELATIEPSASAQGQTAAQPETPAEPALEDPIAESPAATPVEAEPSDQVENGIETPPVEPDPAPAVPPEPDQPSADPSLTSIEPETAETLPEVAPDLADAITGPEIAEETLAAEIEDTEPLERVEPETLAPAPVEPEMDAAAAHPPIDAPAPEPIARVEAADAPPLIAQTPPDTVLEPETPVETSAAEPTPSEASAEATSTPVEPDRAPTTSPEAEISGSSTTVPALPETAPPPVEPPLEQETVEAAPVEPDLHLPERMALLPSARPAPPAARAERATAPARQQRASPRETSQPAQTPPQRRQAASPAAASPRTAAPAARENRRPAASAPAAAPSRAASAGEQEQYARRLARHVERYKRYPAAAARQRITGVTSLSITINRSGGLVAARVASGSGHSVLDEEALAIARRAAPYPRPPENIGDRNFSFTVALRFAR